MTDINELIDKIKGEPDYSRIDTEILRALGCVVTNDRGYPGWAKDGIQIPLFAEHPIQDISATIYLINKFLPGYRWTVGTHPNILEMMIDGIDLPYAVVSKSIDSLCNYDPDTVGEALHENTTIALLIAFLRAYDKETNNG